MAAVPAADDVERMEFQLALRRRGISDQAVLRAMDEVPREYFVAPDFDRKRLCRSGAADRLRADHQPALCRRLYDRAARCRAAAPRARNRHRLGLSGGDPVAAGARGGEHRALPHACRGGARAAQDAGLRNVTILVGDGTAGAPDLAPFDRIMVTRPPPKMFRELCRPACRGRQDGAAARSAPRPASTSSS